MSEEFEDVLRDLAPSGVLRAAINFGNPVLAHRHPQTGEPQGVSVELARELGRRLGVPVEPVTYDAASKVFDAVVALAWNVAFLAIDPSRATQIAFSPPYLLIEGTYLVREQSALRAIADFDLPGRRIAVGRGAAYDLFLTRSLVHAQLVRADTSADAMTLFLRDNLDAAAGVRRALSDFALRNPGLRVIEGRFMSIEQAVGTPKHRPAGARYVARFIEEMKASGFVAASLARAGQHAAAVAPACS
jgi:polar amino acid transport system substrate-binding protein